MFKKLLKSNYLSKKTLINIKLILLLSPILEYIELIIKECDNDKLTKTMKATLIYQLVVRLHSIITIKCDKYKINIDDPDKLMEYLELLCKQIKYNSNTKKFLDLIEETNLELEKQMNDSIHSSAHSRAKELRRMTSSIDDENNIFDIITLNDIDIQRWHIVVKLLNYV